VTVYDGQVPEQPAARYVVLYCDTGTREALSACGANDSATFRFQTTSVGSTPDLANSPAPIARSLSRAVQNALIDVPLTDDQWKTGPTQHTYAQLPLRDEAVMDRAAVYIVDQFSALATRR